MVHNGGEYNHILRCALCGEQKIVGHTIGVIEFQEQEE